MSRQVKRPFPFPACRAKGRKHGTVGAQGRGANPEERKEMQAEERAEAKAWRSWRHNPLGARAPKAEPRA